MGVSSFGATADVVARMMIKHFGIDPEKDMKIVALGPERARFAALKEKVVDVAVLSPPADSEGKKLGFNILARAYELFKFPFTGLGTNVKKIKEKPDEIKRTIKTLIKANRYIRQNRDGAIQVLMEWGRPDRESAAASFSTQGLDLNLGNGSRRNATERFSHARHQRSKIVNIVCRCDHYNDCKVQPEQILLILDSLVYSEKHIEFLSSTAEQRPVFGP